MSASAAPSLTRNGTAADLFYLEEAFAASAAVAVAAQLGVLDHLAGGPADASTLAATCRMDERGAAALLGALVTLGLVALGDDGTYRLATNGLRLLLAQRQRWDLLGEVVRRGTPAVAADTTDGAAALYPSTVAALAALVAPAAERAADVLAAPGLRVLDVGAGAAPWSLPIARRHADCQVAALDLPGVLGVTRAAAEAAGAGPQYRYLAGDLFAARWENAAYDLVIAGNLCHLFGQEANASLLARAFHALRPGGTVAIADVLPNERLDGPRGAVLYGLGLLLRTAHGRAYPFSDYVGWLRSAGFEAIERHDLTDSPPVSLITARRPTA